MKKIILLALTLCIICSCGFHLRGYNNTDFKFPFQTVYLECDNVLICTNFRNVISTNSLANLATQSESAQVTIKLANEQTKRDIQSLNSFGRVSSYLLTYQVEAQIFKHREPIGKTMYVSTQMSMQYNDATILSNNIGEAKLWDQLHIKATNQLVRQIVYFNHRNYSIDESK